MFRLLAKRRKGRGLALIRNDSLCSGNAQNSNEFLLEVSDADEEAGLLHGGPVRHRRVNLLDLAQPMLFFVLVAYSKDEQAESVWSEKLEEGANCSTTVERQYGHS